MLSLAVSLLLCDDSEKVNVVKSPKLFAVALLAATFAGML